MLFQNNILDDIEAKALESTDLTGEQKRSLSSHFQQLRKSKLNILIVGATGSGKSSTINALFNMNTAKVGTSPNPETMRIEKFELGNLVLHDSPGLGDGKEADRSHSKAIVDLLYTKNAADEMLIDLALVILDGSTRDMGTSFELINSVIIPNIQDKSRILVAINQADMAMKGKYWNHAENRPEPELTKFLDEKAASTQRRIRESTEVNVDVIYYSAGYTDPNGEVQKPYNLTKLLAYIVRHIKEEKRIVIAQDINRDQSMWKHDEDLEKYSAEIKKNWFASVSAGIAGGAALGGKIFGPIGAVVGGIIGGFIGLFS